jgi:4-amino-4-deoxy-L-arabinose transferase-like glycosyltransferase
MTARTMALGAGIVALAVVLAAAPTGSDVFEGAEAREALVARAMVETGDWILPLWNGAVMPSKPPLFHWLVATAAEATGSGVTPRTLRAPSVLLAGVVVLLVFAAGAAWGGEQVGLFAALVLATTPQFLAEAGNGRVDMTLCAAVTGAQLAFVRALDGARPGTTLLLALCLALAMLAKGPVGPGLVGLTALAFVLLEGRLRDALRLVRPLPVLLFLAVAGGWYGLAYWHRGDAFLAKQILSENGEALLGGARIPYRSDLYFVGPLVLKGLPWTLVLPWAAVGAWRGRAPRRYCLVWAATVFLFFSLAPLKRAAYLLPLRPALALVTGWWLAEVVSAARSPARLGRIVRGAALAVVGAGIGLVVTSVAVRLGLHPEAALARLGLHDETDVMGYVRAMRAAWVPGVLLGGVTAGAAWAVAVAAGGARWRTVVQGTAVVVACLTAFVQGVMLPAKAAERSMRPFAEAVREQVPDDAPLALLASTEEIGLIFYLGRNVPLIKVGRRPADVPPGYYLIHRGRWRTWSHPPGWEEVPVSPHASHPAPFVLVRRLGPDLAAPPSSETG